MSFKKLILHMSKIFFYILTISLFFPNHADFNNQMSDKSNLDFKYETGNTMLNDKITFPFELVLNHIIVKAKINGNNEFKLALDTGMPVGGIILFKNEKSEKLNLNYSGQTYIGGAGGDPVPADIAAGVKIEIGNLQLVNQQAIVMPINKKVITSLESDGIIGYELFSRYLLQIDFENSSINLWSNTSEANSELGQKLNLEIRQNYPFIQCYSEIKSGNEFPIDLVLDLGASHALSLDLISNKNFSLPENIKESRIGTGAIGDIFGHIGRVSKFSLGEYSFFNVVTTFSNGPIAKGFLKCNGNLGVDILRRFTVTFDYQNTKIYLKPNIHFDDLFVFNMAGFQFHKKNDGNFIVDYIVKNSPADEAGLMLNDTITEINGKQANLTSADEFDKIIKQKNKSLKLKIKRESEVLNFEFKLTEII